MHSDSTIKALGEEIGRLRTDLVELAMYAKFVEEMAKEPCCHNPLRQENADGVEWNCGSATAVEIIRACDHCRAKALVVEGGEC